jgi:hypothetical protein
MKVHKAQDGQPSLECNECGKPNYFILEIGQPDWDSSSAHICFDCINKALNVMKQQIPKNMRRRIENTITHKHNVVFISSEVLPGELKDHIVNTWGFLAPRNEITKLSEFADAIIGHSSSIQATNVSDEIKSYLKGAK